MKKIVIFSLIMIFLCTSIVYAQETEAVNGFSYNSDDYFTSNFAQTTGQNISLGESGWRSLNTDEGQMGYDNNAWFKIDDGKMYLAARRCSRSGGQSRYNDSDNDIAALALSNSNSYLAGNQHIKFETYKEHNTGSMSVRFMVHNNGKSYYAVALGGMYTYPHSGGSDLVAYKIYKVDNGTFTVLKEVLVSDTVPQVQGGQFVWVDLTYTNGTINFKLDAYTYGGEKAVSYSETVTDSSPLEPETATVWLTSQGNAETDNENTRYVFYRNIEINSLSEVTSTYDDGTLKYSTKKSYKGGVLESAEATVTGWSDAHSKDDVGSDGMIWLRVPATITVDSQVYKVTKIGDGAFSADYDNGADNKAVEHMDLSESLITEIGDNAFEKREVRTVALPQTLKKIGKSAFRSCPRLARINIPAGVTEINDATFFNIGTLTSGYENKTVITFEGNSIVFTDGSKVALDTDTPTHVELQVCSVGVKQALTTYLSGRSTDKYTIVDYTSSVQKEYQDENLKYAYTVEKKIVDNADSVVVSDASVVGFSDVLLSTADAENLIDLTIPGSITVGDDVIKVAAIADSAFYGDDVPKVLNSVNVSDANLKSIGKSAFRGQTALREVVLPQSLTSIEQEAFKGCSYLGSINIPAGVTEIKYGTFERIRDKGGSGAVILFEGDNISFGENIFTSNYKVVCRVYYPAVKTALDTYFAGVEQDYRVEHLMKYENNSVVFYPTSVLNGAVLYIAGYNDGILGKVYPVEIDNQSMVNYSLEEAEIISGDYDEIKAFLWNNDTINPYSNGLTIK